MSSSSPIDHQDLTHTFLFHGTGTSSGLPLVPCLTSSKHIPSILCRSCRESIDPSVPLGYKNTRGNLGGILRKKGKDGIWRTIIIDVGKTFTKQAINLFRQHDIKRIDGIILTHIHADASLGLDDLRAFTAPPPTPHTNTVDPELPPVRSSAAAEGYVRTPTIPIWCSQETLDGVIAMFPYLVPGLATGGGGGDLPSLQWNVFDEGKEHEDVDAEVGDLVNGHEKRAAKKTGPDGFWIGGEEEGVWVVPVTVDHGSYFPPSSSQLLSLNLTIEQWKSTPRPYPCNGFIFDGSIVYLSDLNYVPAKAWRRILSALQNDDEEGSLKKRGADEDLEKSTVVDLSENWTRPPNGKLPILIIDTLKLLPHPSHYSFLQALAFASLLRAQSTYLVGFTHPVAHSEWEAACKLIDGTRKQGEEESFVKAVKRSLKDHVDGEKTWEEVMKWGGYVRPAWDGQLLGLTKDGKAVELEGSGPH